jgi:MinD-like ATPase involved in chromosome partitioning or flagellar assembly
MIHQDGVNFMERILVHSYKGGTGKTTVSINVAALLATNNKVLLVENDFMMPSFFTIFNYTPKFYFNDYFNEKVNFNDVIVPELKPNMDVIFTNPDFNPNEKVMSSDQTWFFSMLKRMIKDIEALEERYNYIIFDTPPGWHMVVINLIMLSSKAILIIRPNNYAVNGTKKMVDILYKRAKPLKTWEVFLLFNQIPEHADFSKDIEKWSQELNEAGLKYAGEIPCSCETSYQLAHEINIFPEGHDFTKALKNSLKNIL